MKFDDAARILAGIPYTPPTKGRVLYDLVMQRRPRRILELGFAHGVSSCYFAAAAQELGDCSVTAVDVEASLAFDPSIEMLTERMGVRAHVAIHREKSSYTWFLQREIAKQTRDGVCQPVYDLVFIDGPKDWTNDGAAFFMVDKLLHAGGTVVFDDYAWTYSGHERATGRRIERGYVFPNLSDDERDAPQVKSIFELLVMQHPDYAEFQVVDDLLAIARKTGSSRTPRELRFETRHTVTKLVVTALKRIRQRLPAPLRR